MSLQSAIDATLKAYKDSVVPVDLNDINVYSGREFRKSGCYAFDWVVASQSEKGGLPRGVMVEVYGPEGCGKTTICTIIATQIQKTKKANEVLYLDLEHKYDLAYAYELGVQKDKFTFVHPQGTNPGESGMELMINCAKELNCGLIVFVCAVLKT